MAAGTRTEKDPLGPKEVPSDALYGVQTLRAQAELSDQRAHAAVALRHGAGLDQEGRGADAQGDRSPRREAGRRDRRGRRRGARAASTTTQFVVDPYQAGAGTSHNMNVNEVLANRANELLGGKRGDVHAGASERPREHGAEHERHDPDQHPARRVLSQLDGAGRGVRGAARRARREGARVRRHREGGAHAPAGRDADPPRPGVHRVRGLDRPRHPPRAARRPTTCATSASAAARWAPASPSRRSIRR